MTHKFLLALGLTLASTIASAAGELKALSCVYELQAESYRFARLQLELSSAANTAVAGKVRTQVKAATQELMLNLQEARQGFVALGLQQRHQQLNDQVADYLAEAVSVSSTRDLKPLRAKQAALLKQLADTAQLLTQKTNNPATTGVSLIGGAKLHVEQLAHDFEACTSTCAAQLPAEVQAIEKDLTQMRSTLPKNFSASSAELAKNQMVFLRTAVDSRLRGAPSEAAQTHLIVTAQHLWEIIDEVLDSYTEKSGG